VRPRALAPTAFGGVVVGLKDAVVEVVAQSLPAGDPYRLASADGDLPEMVVCCMAGPRSRSLHTGAAWARRSSVRRSRGEPLATFSSV
jgi:hypothetical protein